ncbi:unnamed protein product [Moneuplotes crassus]|uniref:Uncharacterized protein n=1 Tax=Euplotes crassus TaxID=5936 RepID=A0AAD1XGG6_EUPCR|nr:unnamed protein product [Moneuplotes crassus]
MSGESLKRGFRCLFRSWRVNFWYRSMNLMRKLLFMTLMFCSVLSQEAKLKDNYNKADVDTLKYLIAAKECFVFETQVISDCRVVFSRIDYKIKFYG